MALLWHESGCKCTETMNEIKESKEKRKKNNNESFSFTDLVRYNSHLFNLIVCMFDQHLYRTLFSTKTDFYQYNGNKKAIGMVLIEKV